jgi:outer membrane protein OmpA-like peptidoglycan-associated protein
LKSKSFNVFPFGLNRFLIFILSSIWGIVGLAQTISPKHAAKEGERHYKHHEYLTATHFLEIALKADSNNAKALFQLGVSYSQRYPKAKALHLIERAYAINQKVDKNFYYWHGKALQNNYKFDAAKLSYENYINLCKKKNNPLYALAQKHLIECEHALSLWHKPQAYMVRIVNGNVNTKHSEHRPVVLKNDSVMYFTSTRKSRYVHELNVGFQENSFTSLKNEERIWGQSTLADSMLHLTLNDAVCQIFDNGNKMLLFHTSHGGDIYFSTKKEGKWSRPHRFPNINSNFFESDAYLSEDGGKIFFASNNHTQGGDLDLFMSERTGDSTWSQPKSLGNTLNTTENEGAPFWDEKTNTLYFASKGHSTIGGYDIFRTRYDSSNGHWSQPENMGIPINTPGDDMFYNPVNEGKKAYYTSYRENGFGESDIFEIYSIANVPLHTKVYSKDSLFEFKGFTIILVKYNDSTELERRVITSKKTLYADSIQAGYNYKAYVLNGTDTLYQERFQADFIPSDNKPITKNFYIDVKDEELLSQAYYKGKRVPDLNSTYLYYKYNSSKVDPKGEQKLNKIIVLLKDFPFLKVNITSYSNDQKTGQKSKKLSENRAETVVAYMTEKKIGEDRFKTRYKGVALRKTLNQTTQQKKFNRRTEIKLTR